MKTNKQLGIWMDHSVAHLIELTNDNIITKTIESASALENNEGIRKIDKSLIKSGEQKQPADYFRQLMDVIIDFDEVLLFGSTDAKTELVNRTKNDHHFDKIKISI